MNEIIPWNADGTIPVYTAELIPSPHRTASESVDDLDDAAIGAQGRPLRYADPFVEEHLQLFMDKADALDLSLSAASGLLCGLLDVLWVGRFDIAKAHEDGAKAVDEFIHAVAKYEDIDPNLDTKAIIRKLEAKYPVAADKCRDPFGGPKQHHFREFSHHMSLVGLACSIFTQFTGIVVGTDTEGNVHIEKVPEDDPYIGKNIPEKLMFGTLYWFFHLVSDMAGSSGALGEGTGIPGPILSLMKEFSVLPFFKKSKQNGDGFRHWLSKLYNGTFIKITDPKTGEIRTVRFDLRTEMGVFKEIGQQAFPVILNECLVRGFYFLRRLLRAFREVKPESVADLKQIDPVRILPYKKPAVLRMVSIATAVFEAIDIGQAALAGLREKSVGEFLLRVNFVGIGVFVFAIQADVRAALRMKERERAYDAMKRGELEITWSNLECLELKGVEVQLSFTLQKLLVEHDIRATKNKDERRLKREWLNQWKKSAFESAQMREEDDSLFLTSAEFYKTIRTHRVETGSIRWLYLMVIEAVCFRPYAPLSADEKEKFQKLRCRTSYLQEVFCKKQRFIDLDKLRELRNALKRSEGVLNEQGKKTVFSTVGVLAVAAVTGGIGFVFAPVIAPALAGTAVAGLSGAALTSASLAFFGGGALAAGGLGMAGGTMVIAGGGALLGTLGATGFSLAAGAAVKADGFVYSALVKLLAYADFVLLRELRDLEPALAIQTELNKRCLELEALQAVYEDRGYSKDEEVGKPGAHDSDAEREVLADLPGVGRITKKQAQTLQRSVDYFRLCNDSLAKAIRRFKPLQG